MQSEIARGDDHPADARIDRQPRELAPERRQRARLVDRAQLLQQLETIGDRARRRRLDERKRVDRRETERRHAQDHRRERAPQDLGVGVRRPRGKVVLAVQPHADALRDAAAATRALRRRRLRDLLDLEQRRLVAQRVALDAREARVDHVADAGNGERGLGDVGREHDPAPARGREHALLLGDREPRIERQDLEHRRVRPAREALREHLRGLADLALAREEYEDVARTFAPQVFGGGDDRILELFFVVGLVVARSERPVANLDRKHATGHLDHGRGPISGAEMAREALGVERRRRDDHLEVGPAREDFLQVPQEEVDVEAPLVRFVDDDRVVRGEERVALRLGEQDPVGHQLHERVGLRVVGETDLVADRLARRRPELLRDPRRDRARGDAPRLRMPDEPTVGPAQREADLRQLRRLARSGLAADDHDGVGGDRRGDLVGPLRDRQLGRIGDRRTTRRAGARRSTERAIAASIFCHSGAPADPRRARSIRRASAGASADIVSGSRAVRRAAGEVAAMRRATILPCRRAAGL